MKFMSYDSTFNISDYTVGMVYAFYLRNNALSNLVAAEYETINKYAPIIVMMENDNQNFVEVNGTWLAFTRALGVVVDKHYATGIDDFDWITVMFKTNEGGYVLNKYIVGTQNVFMNNKDNVLPTITLNLQLDNF